MDGESCRVADLKRVMTFLAKRTIHIVYQATFAAVVKLCGVEVGMLAKSRTHTANQTAKIVIQAIAHAMTSVSNS